MNSEMKLNEINKLLKAGDVAAAESVALELLKKEPGNLQAKMLYGTCLQLQGDRESFGRIHEELVPKMTVVSDEKTLSMWHRYHALWMTLMVGGLVLAGTVGTIYVIFADQINKYYNAMTQSPLYASPEYFELKVIEGMPDGPEKSARLQDFREREEQSKRTVPEVGLNEFEN